MNLIQNSRKLKAFAFSTLFFLPLCDKVVRETPRPEHQDMTTKASESEEKTVTLQAVVKNNQRIVFLGQFRARVEIYQKQLVLRFDQAEESADAAECIELTNPLRIKLDGQIKSVGKLKISAKPGKEKDEAIITVTGPEGIISPKPQLEEQPKAPPSRYKSYERIEDNETARV